MLVLFGLGHFMLVFFFCYFEQAIFKKILGHLILYCVQDVFNIS